MPEKGVWNRRHQTQTVCQRQPKPPGWLVSPVPRHRTITRRESPVWRSDKPRGPSNHPSKKGFDLQISQSGTVPGFGLRWGHPPTQALTNAETMKPRSEPAQVLLISPKATTPQASRGRRQEQDPHGRDAGEVMPKGPNSQLRHVTQGGRPTIIPAATSIECDRRPVVGVSPRSGSSQEAINLVGRHKPISGSNLRLGLYHSVGYRPV